MASSSSFAIEDDYDDDEDYEALLGSIHEESNFIPPTTARQDGGIISDIFRRIRRDGLIINSLGGDDNAHIVEWYGNEQAEVLFLCSMPLSVDSKILDKEQRLIHSKVNPIFKKYNQDSNFVIASCTAGRNKKDRFVKSPKAIDVALTAKYLRELLLRMPNLRLVISLDNISAEFMHRNLDPFHMYGVTSFQAIKPFTKPSAIMYRRKTSEVFDHTHIEGKIVVRTLYVDIYNKHLSNYISHALSRLYDTVQPLLKMSTNNTPAVAPPGSSGDLLTYENFSTRLREDFEQAHQLRQAGDAVDPTTNIASHFIPATNAPENHIYIIKTAYDPNNNWMNLFTRLPDGSACLVRAHDPVFTFWFRAHRAFAAEPSTWQPRIRELHNDNLCHLTGVIDSKLKYMWYTHRSAYQTRAKEKVRPFTFSVEPKDRRYAFSDGYTHEYKASFIRCDVRHHDFIAVIIKHLQQMVTEYTDKQPANRKRSKTTKAKPASSSSKKVRFMTDDEPPPSEDQKDEYEDDWDPVFFFDYLENKFHTFMATTPENMFANMYGIRMSHWHVVDDLKFDRLEMVDGTNVPRLSIRDVTMVDERTIRYVPSSRDIVIREGLTGMDAPQTMRLAYDIECVAIDGGYRTVPHLDPVVCICAVVRIHDENKTQFISKEYIHPVTGEKVAPNYTPVGGYAYYCFMLGTAKTDQPGVAHTDEKVGSEHVFSFQNEADMLRSFWIWRRVMLPAYIYTHNGRDFDEPYLLTRSRVLGIDIPSQGYIEGEMSRTSRYKFQSRGTAEMMISVVEGQNGIVHADTLVIFRGEYRTLPSKGLGYLSNLFVQMTKSEMPYHAIAGHWRDSDKTRRKLIDYCYRDAQLCDQLINCKSLVTVISETARSCRVSEDRIHDAGMQEKVYGAMSMQNFAIKNTMLINSDDMKERRFADMLVEKFMDVGNEEDDEDDEEENDDKVIVATLKDPDPEPQPKKTVAADIMRFFQSSGTCSSSSKISKQIPETEASSSSNANDISIIRALNLKQNDNARNPEYQGAVVMSVPFDFHYKYPAGCLDFASLYPSIMRAFNQCSSTLIFFSDMKYYGVDLSMCKLLPEDHLGRNPRTGKMERYAFIKNKYRKGLLTLTQDALVNDRNEVKRILPKYDQEFLENGAPNPDYNKLIASNLLQKSNGKKLVANSSYGATGTDGKIGNKLIASAVTAVGRHYIMLARMETEKQFGGVCVGGDTDSIFMIFPGDENGNYRITTPDEMAKFAKIWVAAMSLLFRKKCKLEYEKCMHPLITIAKKRYANGHHEPGKTPIRKTKGMETVRRDALPYLKVTLAKILEMMIVLWSDDMTFDKYVETINERKKETVDYITQRAKDLLEGKVGISELILSKNLSSEYYTNQKQEHLTVVRLKKERGQTPPTVGERVHYVYILHPDDATTRKQRKGYQIADDPQWAIEHDLKLNYVHYLENKFVKPIVRIMCYFLKHEMIERIKKRNPKVVDITLKMLKDETENYLFSPARKGSVNRKRQHSHFAALSGNRIVLAKADKSNKSSIAFYSEKQSSVLEEERKSQGVFNDDVAVVSSCLEKLQIYEEKYNSCLKKCRGCLKIKPHQEIMCDAYECKFYHARIIAKKDFEQTNKKVESLLVDIEDLA